MRLQVRHRFQSLFFPTSSQTKLECDSPETVQIPRAKLSLPSSPSIVMNLAPEGLKLQTVKSDDEQSISVRNAIGTTTSTDSGTEQYVTQLMVVYLLHFSLIHYFTQCCSCVQIITGHVAALRPSDLLIAGDNCTGVTVWFPFVTTNQPQVAAGMMADDA